MVRKLILAYVKHLLENYTKFFRNKAFDEEIKFLRIFGCSKVIIKHLPYKSQIVKQASEKPEFNYCKFCLIKKPLVISSF